jgi:hypothetical protein
MMPISGAATTPISVMAVQIGVFRVEGRYCLPDRFAHESIVRGAALAP